MKRIWLGAGVLLALVAVGLLAMQLTQWQLGQVCETLKQASEAPNWDDAAALAQQARRDWEQSRHLMAALEDHAALDTADELFAQLEVYRRCRAVTDHAAICARLSEIMSGLVENHRLTWWNLL